MQQIIINFIILFLVENNYDVDHEEEVHATEEFEFNIQAPNQEPPGSFLYQQPGNFYLLNATETTYNPIPENENCAEINDTSSNAFMFIASQKLKPKIVFRPHFRQKLVTKNGLILNVVSNNANQTYINL